MRHAASLLAAMEGINRATFRVARELANNSRSGLTIRFLAKKLDVPDEEVEYIVDLNHRFLFVDLTKIKIVAEGINSVKRITRGLENHGDIPSLFRAIKALSPQEFRQLEDLVGMDGPCAKKTVAEEIIERCYKHPDSVVTYVATRGFSAKAREVFDIVWQSPEGIVPISRIRAVYGGTEFEVEQALSELFRGFALFEMFRFDAEDRLVRVAGLLSELRQVREQMGENGSRKVRLKAHANGAVQSAVCHGLDFSEMICRLVAALAAKPARLRGDGELFREDRRRLSDICPEDAEPSLNTCLWVAQGVNWLARVDNELRAGELDALLTLDRVGRHRILYDWLLSADKEGCSRRLLRGLLEELKPGTWYRTVDVVRNAMAMRAEDEQPVLKCSGGHWHYVSPGASSHSEKALIRAFEETLLWLGIVDHGDDDGDGVVRVTELGVCLLTCTGEAEYANKLPPRKAEIVVQPNFDIVVSTQDMDPLLTVPLDQFADRVSTGLATVYRMSKDSFTRAVQEGHDAGAFVSYLLAHNRGKGLPSNVMTTLEDWRGGMKRVRLRTIQIIESDDPLVMADLLHRKRFKKFLSGIDPQTVATYAKIPRAELARQLEKDGFVVD